MLSDLTFTQLIALPHQTWEGRVCHALKIGKGSNSTRPGLYFLAGVLAVTGSFTVVRLLQIVLGTCAVALVFVSADEWFGRRAAWLAGGVAALTGLFTFYESLLLQAALDPFLTAAALAALTFGLRYGRDRWYALAEIGRAHV